ncbi:hypothetical protein BH11BAC5_BH11BAC5_33270 [soil metagenome]
MEKVGLKEMETLKKSQEMSNKMNIYFKPICLVNIVFFFMVSVEGCFPSKEIKNNLIEYNDQDWNRDSVLVKSLRHVDSIVKKSNHLNSLKGKSFYSDLNSLTELKSKTGIGATGDVAFIGFKFTFEDWLKWHDWFRIHFRNDHN